MRPGPAGRSVERATRGTGAHFSGRARGEVLARLAEREWDLLVVGGGITGAALAHRAGHAGLRVALVDKGDFASGTSSRSSRLIHGGLRYLRHGQVRIVVDSLREQVRLARAAPHLVRPIWFLLPLYSDTPLPRWGIRALLAMYHRLRPAGGRVPYYALGADAARAREGLLRAAGLRGAYLYQEFSTHDARLVLETLLAAWSEGADVANYVGLVDFLRLRDRVVGAVLRDVLTGQVLEARARVVVNATGPWSDVVVRALRPDRRLRLTKGVHIVLPRRRLPLAQGVTLFAPSDGRPLMALPMENLAFVGPTETEYDGDPDRASAEPGDVRYLLETVDAAFPGLGLGEADVIGTTAGLRPLNDQPTREPGQMSRAYRMEWGPEGLLSIYGGKLTLHRLAAEEAMRFLWPHLRGGPRPGLDGAAPLPGGRWDRPQETVAAALRAMGLPPAAVEHHLRTYGSRGAILADLLRDHAAWRESILPSLPQVWGEVALAMEWEMAQRPEDFTVRRTDFALQAAAEGLRSPERITTMWDALRGAATIG